MSGSANVRSIDAVRDFRSAVQKFEDETVAALEALQLELNRAIEWIEHDRPAYWAAQVRRAFDEVAKTRTALSTCQMRTVAGRRSSCIEEKVAYEKAKRRLQFCQEQTERVRKWAVKIHHEVNEYRGRIGGLRRMIEAGVPKLGALLDRTISSLEAYAEIPQPPTEDAGDA